MHRKRWKPRFESFDVETKIDGKVYRGSARVKHGRPGTITVSYDGRRKTTWWGGRQTVAEIMLFELVTERPRSEFP